MFEDAQGSVFIAEFKSDNINKEQVRQNAEKYSAQLEIYLKAAKLLFKGKNIKGALVFLRPHEIYFLGDNLMFDNLKKLMELKKTMTEVKKRLDEMVIKVESPAKNFEMTISGSQQVKEMKVLTDLKNLSKEEAEKDLAELFNKAVRDSQAMAAQAMGGLANLGL